MKRSYFRASGMLNKTRNTKIIMRFYIAKYMMRYEIACDLAEVKDA